VVLASIHPYCSYFCCLRSSYPDGSLSFVESKESKQWYITHLPSYQMLYPSSVSSFSFPCCSSQFPVDFNEANQCEIYSCKSRHD
jgi:hypothetical protein